MRNAILVLAAAGCNGEKTTDSGDTASAGYDATWTGVQALFVDHCDRCHTAQYPELHTDLVTDLTSGYGMVVVAGDPDNSALWQVVSAPSPFQSPMPFDTGLLPAATVDPIREWIANGAPLE
ncbi:MAG: hypothetical protein ABMA64_42945 [Myxococcota bacterium]